MRQFDFYEFAGILAPGAVLLIGISMLRPELREIIVSNDLTLGTLGIFVILAYVAGHLVQTLGNAVETAWWWGWRGWPSDWVRTGNHHMLSGQQLAILKRSLHASIGFPAEIDFPSLTQRDWAAITRQVYAAVSAHGRADRVDTFNGGYGLNRGIAAALLSSAFLTVVWRPELWTTAVIVLFAAGLALTRMHRFGKHYARELFVQFLQLPNSTKETGAQDPVL